MQETTTGKMRRARKLHQGDRGYMVGDISRQRTPKGTAAWGLYIAAGSFILSLVRRC